MEKKIDHLANCNGNESNGNPIQNGITSNNNTTPNNNNNGGWMKWQRTEDESDPQLLEGIAASLRDYQGIEPIKPEIVELDDTIANNLTRMENPNYPVGIVGLRNTQCLTSIIQAIYHFKPLYNEIIKYSYQLDDFGEDLDCLDVGRTMEMADLVKQLAIVMAGLNGSTRGFKSAVLLHLAFLDYRNNFHLGIPTSLEDCWSYFLHAIVAKIPSINVLTHIQVVRQDQGGMESDNLLMSLSVNGPCIHECLTNITLANQSFLYKSTDDLIKGRIIAFNCTSQNIPQFPVVLHVDRYLEKNSALVLKLLDKQKLIKEEVLKLKSSLSSFSPSVYKTLADTIDLLQKECQSPDLVASLIQFQSSLQSQEAKIIDSISTLKAEVTDLYSIPELHQYPFKIYAVFNAKSVHINTEHGWYKFEGKVVTPTSYTEAIKEVASVWYTYGEADRLELPEKLNLLIQKDNQRFAEELSII